MIRTANAVRHCRRHARAGASVLNTISASVGDDDTAILSQRRLPNYASGVHRSVGTLHSIAIRVASCRSTAIGITQHHYRPYSASRKRPNGPSSDNNDQSNDNNSTSDGQSTGTAAINQRATDAILSQLSSPPNILTVSRILATPYLSYLLISHRSESAAPASVVGDDGTTAAVLDAATEVATAADAISTASGSIDLTSTPVIALSLFLAMGFTDFLDGYIARTFPSTATVLGTYLDPFADKFFISAVSLTLWHTGILPGALVGLWVARDVGIVGAVYWLVRQETIRKRNGKNADSGDDSASESIAVMDPTNTPLKVQASLLSKVNTTLQIGLIALGIAGEVPQIDIPPELMTSLIWITAGTTIGSSLGYLDGSALKKSGNKGKG